MRERSLRVPDLTLNEALEIGGAAEAIQSQLKQMRNLHEVNEEEERKVLSKETRREEEISKRQFSAD